FHTCGSAFVQVRAGFAVGAPEFSPDGSTGCAHHPRRVAQVIPSCPQQPVDNRVVLAPAPPVRSRFVACAKRVAGRCRCRHLTSSPRSGSGPGRGPDRRFAAASSIRSPSTGGASQVSVAEFARSGYDGDDEYAGGPSGGDRMPPQDNVAEQSVLGSMLLSKDAIADVVEAIRGTDFYRPAHEVIYDAILDLYGRGEPADPVTVAAELQRRGELQRVGGAPYLHTLSASVPIAA